MRTLCQFVGVLLVVAFIGTYFWWLIVAAAVAGLAWLVVRWYGAARVQAAKARDAQCRAGRARISSTSGYYRATTAASTALMVRV